MLRTISSRQEAWKGTSPSSNNLYNSAIAGLLSCVSVSETRVLTRVLNNQAPANQPSARHAVHDAFRRWRRRREGRGRALDGCKGGRYDSNEVRSRTQLHL